MLRVDSLLRLDFVPPVREMDKASLMFTPEDIEQTFMIEGQILSHSGPLLFFRSKELPPENVVGNGSFGLVDTGKKKLVSFHRSDQPPRNMPDPTTARKNPSQSIVQE